MTTCQLQELAQATQGQILSEIKNQFSGIGTDTRKDLSNQVFWALQGESFDAHDFLDVAVRQGASALVVHQLPEKFKDLAQTVTILKVPDTLRALQDFAHSVRKKWGGVVIGITGSNGKTTSKEFAQAVLETAFEVHSNKGSFNNHFGLPFNLLQAPASSELILAEMGMNHFGEITRLCEIAEPDIVVCSMVGRAHIEHFGSIDEIAKAKEEIYKAAPAQATRIYNLDNVWTKAMYDRAHKDYPDAKKMVTFSQVSRADIQLKLKSMTMRDLTVTGSILGLTGEVTVPVFGAQNVTNLCVAAACGLAAGMTAALIWEALPRCKTTWGRNQFVQTKKGAEILFDAYNANPDSMKALLDNARVLECAGKKVGVFAEMLEMGEHSGPGHRELGELVGRTGFDVVYFYGKPCLDFEAGMQSSGFEKTLFVSDTYEEKLATQVAGMLQDGDLVLVKGSRGMKLERFVFLCEPLNFENK
ncbi:MAG: UDP-N-acetylmuramoyl-tripeptide--D-alanyl-D-alanine ligase [Bdellovibrio sp.]